MVSTRSNKVYYNDAGGIENHRISANIAKVVAAVKKDKFCASTRKKTTEHDTTTIVEGY